MDVTRVPTRFAKAPRRGLQSRSLCAVAQNNSHEGVAQATVESLGKASLPRRKSSTSHVRALVKLGASLASLADGGIQHIPKMLDLSGCASYTPIRFNKTQTQFE